MAVQLRRYQVQASYTLPGSVAPGQLPAPRQSFLGQVRPVFTSAGQSTRSRFRNLLMCSASSYDFIYNISKVGNMEGLAAA